MESKATLDVVCRVLDSLVRVGDRYHGLLPSAIDLSTHEMLAQLATPIEGQRPGDRAPGGSNLMLNHEHWLMPHQLDNVDVFGVRWVGAY